MRIVFWNCGVAPAANNANGGKVSQEDAEKAIRAIASEGPTIICLCEVDAPAIEGFRSVLDGYHAVSMLDAEPGTRWDLGILFPEYIEIGARSKATGGDGGMGVRAGCAWEVKCPQREGFVLYLLHWRSRLMGGGDEYRSIAAASLWPHVQARLQAEIPVVIVGDFNDEPFDNSLTALRTTRDPNNASRYPKARLYNLTWNFSGPPDTAPWEAYGSISATSSSRKSERHLFDQALVSADYLDADAKTHPTARLLWHNAVGDDHIPLEILLP